MKAKVFSSSSPVWKFNVFEKEYLGLGYDILQNLASEARVHGIKILVLYLFPDFSESIYHLLAFDIDDYESAALLAAL